jgi:hypothetical protein
MTLEERLKEHLSSPGAYITEAEKRFIIDMRIAALEGVGYGWMRQIILWEWQSKDPAVVDDGGY